MNIQSIVSRMNKKQTFKYNRMTGKYKIRYLSTFMGNKDSLDTSIAIPDTSDRPIGKTYTKGQMYREWIDKNKALYDCSKAKIPSDNNSDWIGIEIECYLPKLGFNGVETNGDCDGSCRDNCECYEYSCNDCGHEFDEPQGECECECTEDCGGLPCNGINAVREALEKLKVKNVQVVSDGSLRDTRELFGVEIKVLCRLSDFHNLAKVCDFLKLHDAIVDKSTGLHVHLDCRANRDWHNDMIKQRFSTALAVLVTMIPISRRENQYCKYGVSSVDRYSMINAKALQEHGTIEVRMHSGTTNYTKIVQWCQLLSYIKNHSDIGFNESWLVNLPSELLNYVTSRASKFSDNSEESTNEREVA